MADPLSICASVAGVVTFAAQISVSIANFVACVRDAPQYVLALKQEVDSLHTVLHHLHRKLSVDFSGSIPYPPEISADLKDLIDHLDAELKYIGEYVKDLNAHAEKDRAWHSFVSAIKRKFREDDITQHQRTIEAYKSSLNVLVVITTGFATTQIHQLTGGTHATAEQIQKELNSYQQTSIRMFEKSFAKIQENAELTEQLKRSLETFLKTTQTSVVKKTIFAYEPAPGESQTEENPKVNAIDRKSANQVIPAPNEPEPESSGPGSDITVVKPSEVEDAKVDARAVQGGISGGSGLEQSNASQEPVRVTLSSAPQPPPAPADEDPELSSALRIAAENGNVEMIELLLDIGASINAVDNSGATALRLASRLGRVKAVQYLLRRGADPDVGKGRNLPVIGALLAASSIYTDPDGDVLRALIQAKVQVNSPAVMYTAAEHCSPKILEMLLDAGAAINVIAVDLEYPTVTLGSPLQVACSLGRTENIAFLLDHKADPNLGGGRLENPLVAAIHFCGNHPDHDDIIQLLLDHGARANTPGVLHSAVWQACWNKSKPLEMNKIIRRLLDGGADVNALDQFGHSALYEAALHGAGDAVSLLLDRGADQNVGESAFRAAVSQSHVQVATTLRERSKT